ncbi:MAG: peptidase dimerization domain-containing protein [Candidatus Rokubacteria bacterium]|nr:peptidase dimerization domain-containing protein [Candidatus Rokubacteria bacterium]
MTTFALTMLRGSEKRNVIPPAAVADVDCRLLAGDDPDEVLAWVRAAVGDEHVEVQATAPAKRPNLSAPDTKMYKAIAGAIERREPGAVPTPSIFPGFTDNRVFRRAGVRSYAELLLAGAGA